MACSKFDEHWISRYQSRENIASMTSLGIVQEPALLHQHSRYQWNFFLPRRPFNTSCTVPSTSNLPWIRVNVILVGGGVPNSTLQRRWTSATFSTIQEHFSSHLRSSNDNFIIRMKFCIGPYMWYRYKITCSLVCIQVKPYHVLIEHLVTMKN